ncbi:MAG: Glyoxalase/bleomycin resistance protein/dioxygenase [Acidobacteriales bacterium]|nr:Glyoxalase/bleomycin resistance protein/dioxygenase [Terriglobales bacterium]
MLGNKNIIAFVPTRNAEKAKAFYESTLGLRFVSDDGFAMVFDANGTMIRIAKVSKYDPWPFTILGWQVTGIEKLVTDLRDKGVKFEIFEGFGQDELGIWPAPDGSAKVAWFKDPDGNMLSVSQHK